MHTGAPPPWFEAVEESQINGVKPVLRSFVSSSSKSGKSKKLNPKRVGAAWAERRKLELEMEKRGELVKNEFDANWLPNFGRVWQSGSRRESRKEFELEKQNILKVETQLEEPRLKRKVESLPEEPVKIQPYISKRMVKLKFSLHCMSPISYLELNPAKLYHSFLFEIRLSGSFVKQIRLIVSNTV